MAFSSGDGFDASDELVRNEINLSLLPNSGDR